jgi:hypothetical protein
VYPPPVDKTFTQLPVTHLKFHPHVPHLPHQHFILAVTHLTHQLDQPFHQQLMNQLTVSPDVDVYSNDYHSRGKTHNQQMWL